MTELNELVKESQELSHFYDVLNLSISSTHPRTIAESEGENEGEGENERERTRGKEDGMAHGAFYSTPAALIC